MQRGANTWALYIWSTLLSDLDEWLLFQVRGSDIHSHFASVLFTLWNAHSAMSQNQNHLFQANCVYDYNQAVRWYGSFLSPFNSQPQVAYMHSYQESSMPCELCVHWFHSLKTKILAFGDILTGNFTFSVNNFYIYQFFLMLHNK